MSETSSDSRRRYDSSARRAQAARTRERIVAAAVELVHDFASWNWDELTFRAVAARAGVAVNLTTGLGQGGDAQGDRRVHGGPEKAVHYYPAEHYARLAERVPDVAALLVPGVLGENLSGHGLTEAAV